MENQEGVKNPPAGPTWWFEGNDRKPFPAEEKEAFEIMTNRSSWKRHDLRLIGYSDGSAYNEIIRSAGTKARDLGEKVAEIKKDLNRYIAGHDKLRFEDMAEETDPRVVRAKKMIEELQAQVDPLEEELKSLRTNLIGTAFSAELEKARGVIKNPRDFSVITQATNNSQHQQALQNFANAKRVI
jgi:polyhydroxyalkanoate synthesis regulator phasin